MVRSTTRPSSAIQRRCQAPHAQSAETTATVNHRLSRVRMSGRITQVRRAGRREAGVVRLRFGLTDGQPRTLDEIGQVYGVTRERIRQIESKTMSKLRHPSRSQVLRDYLD